MFEHKRIANTRQKAIPMTDRSSFTSIITFYECNVALLSLYLGRKKGNNKRVGPKDLNEYRRFRPDDDTIYEFKKFCFSVWDEFSEDMEVIQEYLNEKVNNTIADNYRNKEGGNLLFRPIGLKPFILASIEISLRWNCSFKNAFRKLNQVPLSIERNPWVNVVWNKTSKRMATPNEKLLMYMLIFFVNKKLLHERELEFLLKEYAAAKALPNDEEMEKVVYDVLNKYRIDNRK